MGLDFARPVFVRAAPQPGDSAVAAAAAAAAAGVSAMGVPPEPRLDSPRKNVSIVPLSVANLAISRHEWNEIRDACRTGDAAKLQSLVLQGVLVPRKLTGSPTPSPVPGKAQPVALNAALAGLADMAARTPSTPQLSLLGDMGPPTPGSVLAVLPVGLSYGMELARHAHLAIKKAMDNFTLDTARDALVQALPALENQLVRLQFLASPTAFTLLLCDC